MIGPVEELPNGVVVHQATDEAMDKSNIYCEFPWCPPSSRCFVYVRYVQVNGRFQSEYVACEFGSWYKQVIGSGGACTMANGGKFYYSRFHDHGQREFIRVDLDTMHSQVIPLPAGVPSDARLDISPGERYVAYNQVISYRPQRFSLGLADLHSGECRILHEDPFICNPHHQFEPRDGRFLLVQHNRGCIFSPEGKMECLVGKEGCSLFCLEIPSGKVIRLPVGPPHTYSLSGHETWLGDTGELLFTTNIQEDYDHGKGPIMAVRPGDEVARIICAPWQMNHIGIEPSGRIFCADTYEPDQILIGSPRTNKAEPVCSARATYQRSHKRKACEDSHPHAYISPDRRWVVFNSDRTGIQQIYCARIPPEMIANIESGS